MARTPTTTPGCTSTTWSSPTAELRTEKRCTTGPHRQVRSRQSCYRHDARASPRSRTSAVEHRKPPSERSRPQRRSPPTWEHSWSVAEATWAQEQHQRPPATASSVIHKLSRRRSRPPRLSPTATPRPTRSCAPHRTPRRPPLRTDITATPPGQAHPRRRRAARRRQHRTRPRAHPRPAPACLAQPRRHPDPTARRPRGSVLQRRWRSSIKTTL